MRVITPGAILSYPNLFEPRAQNDQQEPKYSCALVFTDESMAAASEVFSNSPETLKELKAAVLAVAKEKWGDKAVDMLKKGQLRTPFRDDWEAKGYPEGSTFFNCRTKQRPGIVSSVPDPDTGAPMPITEPSEIGPGDIVRASVTAFAYDTSGNRGVSFGLNNIQKIKSGDASLIGATGRVTAADEFEADEAAVADLSDLTDESGDDDGDLDMSDLL